MAEENIVAYRVKITPAEGEERIETHIPQNWSVKHHGALNPDNLKKFIQTNYGDTATVTSVEPVKAVINKDAFLADRGSLEARPIVKQ